MPQITMPWAAYSLFFIVATISHIPNPHLIQFFAKEYVIFSQAYI